MSSLITNSLRLPAASAAALSVVITACVFLAPPSLQAANEELPLPNWTPAQDATPPGVTPPLRSQVSPLLPEAPPEDRFDPFKLFIPHTSAPKTERESPPPPSVALQEVGSDTLRQANDLPDDTLLLDPEGLLTETQTEDLRRLLHTHASEAIITPRILVIGRDQVLPKDAKLTGLASGALTRQPSCLLVYPLGDPKRVRLFTSQEISRVTPAGYLAKMSADCVTDCLQVSNDVEQLQRFATQLSIRLFWLERAFDFLPQGQESAAIAAVTPSRVLPASPTATHGKDAAEAAKLDPLPEVVPAPPPTILPAAALEKWKSLAGKIAWGGAIGIASLATLLILIRWRRRRLRQMVWLLPEIEHVERLGGSHSGGSGAMIKYG